MNLSNAARVAVSALLLSAAPALAHDIKAKANPGTSAPFDLVETSIRVDGAQLVFRSQVRGAAGSERPAAAGQFAGASVYAYVWPTSLNSGDIGFARDQGIVALAATFHPDFDDAAKGAKNRDIWHSHWVILAPDAACGGGLKVRDIPKDAKPKVPETWPGVPLLIDSPAYLPEFKGEAIEVRVPRAAIGAPATFKFDGVTAGLKVNANLHAPLLCVDAVFKVASGDLSLPGQVMGQ